MPSSTTGPFSSRSGAVGGDPLAVGDPGGVHQALATALSMQTYAAHTPQPT